MQTCSISLVAPVWSTQPHAGASKATAASAPASGRARPRLCQTCSTPRTKMRVLHLCTRGGPLSPHPCCRTRAGCSAPGLPRCTDSAVHTALALAQARTRFARSRRGPALMHLACTNLTSKGIATAALQGTDPYLQVSVKYRNKPVDPEPLSSDPTVLLEQLRRALTGNKYFSKVRCCACRALCVRGGRVYAQAGGACVSGCERQRAAAPVAQRVPIGSMARSASMGLR